MSQAYCFKHWHFKSHGSQNIYIRHFEYLLIFTYLLTVIIMLAYHMYSILREVRLYTGQICTVLSVYRLRSSVRSINYNLE